MTPATRSPVIKRDVLGVSGALGMLSRHVWDPDGALHQKAKPVQTYFVHYTVTNPPEKVGPPHWQHCVAGPYSESEVLDERRDIATYTGVTDAYVSESHERAKA